MHQAIALDAGRQRLRQAIAEPLGGRNVGIFQRIGHANGVAGDEFLQRLSRQQLGG